MAKKRRCLSRKRRNPGKYFCGKCGIKGHNSRTCKKTGKPVSAKVENKSQAVKTFSILTHQISRNEMWSIHLAGCKDIARNQQENDAIIHNLTGTLQQAIDSVLDEDTRELGWSEEHLKIHNCAKKAKRRKLKKRK